MQIAHHASYDAIGTQAAPATLTAAYTGNTSSPILARYLHNLHLDIGYIPATNNAYLEFIIECSNDDLDATPTNWYQIGGRVTGTTEIDAYADSGTDMGTASGIPVIVPGDKTTTATKAITHFEDFDISCNFVRIRAKEILPSGTDFGTASIRVSVSS
jgi:hypothetical protein